MLKNKIIYISGTPCTGKTTLVTELSSKLSNEGYNCKFIKVNDFAIENDLVDGEDPEKFYKVINIEKLNESLNVEINKFLDEDCDLSDFCDKIVIVEGHLAHLCDGADKTIVLRLNPNILKERLTARNYADSKVHENCEAEALAVCSVEAYELYGEDTNEIDCTDKSVDELITTLLDIIYGKSSFPVGDIDFMEWIMVN